MKYKITNVFRAEALFEIDVNTDGSSYIVIFGKHINGYFCCIPNWNLGCEMTSPSNINYNMNKLKACGLKEQTALGIARAICEQSTKQ